MFICSPLNATSIYRAEAYLSTLDWYDTRNSALKLAQYEDFKRHSIMKAGDLEAIIPAEIINKSGTDSAVREFAHPCYERAHAHAFR